MEQITLHFTGVAPLLMHRPVTVNTLDPLSIELRQYTKKRIKTEDDHKIIARLEWEAGLYHDAELGPYLPGVNAEACLLEAAKITKQGPAIKRGVTAAAEKLPIRDYGHRGTTPPTIQELWDANLKDIQSVGNQQNRVMRCRPMFPRWSLTVPLLFESAVIDERDLRAIAERAGIMVGLGDYRPRYGRFEVA
jgi:hypothetical protein